MHFLTGGKDDVLLFVRELTRYGKRKLLYAGDRFESYKSWLVEILMIKRGKHSSSFLNLSVFLLFASAVIAAPHISSYYPTIAYVEVLSSVATPSGTVAQLDFDQLSMTTQISDKPRDQIIEYTVKPGDTLSTIAATFDVSEETLRWANNLTGKNPVLKPGQILNIPPVTGVVHKVKRGDTVYTIAKKYETEAQNIVNYPFNDFVDLENFTLAVGQLLVVPGGVMPEEVKPGVTRPPAPQYLAKQSSGQFLFPTSGSVSQQPIWYHMALDIANKEAPDVYASEAGTVSQVICVKGGYGCHIIINHGGGTETLYAHLQSFYVSAGASVTRGQALGRMGSTGRSTGTHLHFEVIINGARVNPWGYVK